MPSPDRERLEELADAASPNDARKPAHLQKITKASWIFIIRSSYPQYKAKECTNLSGSLTYRALFAIFPGMVALVSMLSLVGKDEQSVDLFLDDLQRLASEDTWDVVEPILRGVLSAPAAGFGLIVGLAVALWSASSWVKAFAEAMNRIYEVPEGRKGIKLTVQMYVLTAFLLLLGALGMLSIVLTGPWVDVLFSHIGLGESAADVWMYLKWFVLAGVIVLVTALLYWLTPNVQQPKFRWMTTGSFVAIVITVIATLIFTFYVRNFADYDATYGSLAGVIIFLVWLYIANSILLFGAVLDSEIERARELQAGLAAEWEIQLPVRAKAAYQEEEKRRDVEAEKARALRLSAGRTSKIEEVDTKVLE